MNRENAENAAKIGASNGVMQSTKGVGSGLIQLASRIQLRVIEVYKGPISPAYTSLANCRVYVKKKITWVVISRIDV